jgi:hypothetical protein
MLALRRRCNADRFGRSFHFARVAIACHADVLHNVLLYLVEQVCRTHPKEHTAATPGRLGPHGILNVFCYNG